jgi:hypothetical protein
MASVAGPHFFKLCFFVVIGLISVFKRAMWTAVAERSDDTALEEG